MPLDVIERVVHRTRPSLGVGRVIRAFKGNPIVLRVEWPVPSRNGLPLWGDYRITDLAIKR